MRQTVNTSKLVASRVIVFVIDIVTFSTQLYFFEIFNTTTRFIVKENNVDTIGTLYE